MVENFGNLLLGLYRLAHECPLDSFQGMALDALKDQLHFDSGRWASGELPSSGRRRIHHTYLHDEPVEVLAAYQEVRDDDAPMAGLLHGQGTRPLATAYHSASRFSGRGTAAFRDYQRRFRHENVLTVADKRKIDGVLQYRLISIYRGDANQRFDDADVRLMQLAMPHLMQALTINRLTNLASVAACSAAAMQAVAITDFAGTVLHSEPNLCALLTLECEDPMSDHLPAWLWSDLSRGRPYLGRAIIAVAQRIQALVYIRVRKRCAADGLSRRELEVAGRLARGQTHKYVARDLGISPNTARNHIQKIHEKLGTHNGAEIVATLAERSFA